MDLSGLSRKSTSHRKLVITVKPSPCLPAMEELLLLWVIDCVHCRRGCYGLMQLLIGQLPCVGGGMGTATGHGVEPDEDCRLCALRRAFAQQFAGHVWGRGKREVVIVGAAGERLLRSDAVPVADEALQSRQECAIRGGSLAEGSQV